MLRLDLDRKEPSWLSLRVVYPRRATITFELGDWIDVSLGGFSGQNVIGELVIRTAGNRTVEVWERGVDLRLGQHELELLPIFGAHGLIRATVKSVNLREDNTPVVSVHDRAPCSARPHPKPAFDMGRCRASDPEYLELEVTMTTSLSSRARPS